MTKIHKDITLDEYVFDQWKGKGNENLSAFVQHALLQDLNLQKKSVRICLKCDHERDDAGQFCNQCGSQEYIGKVVFR